MSKSARANRKSAAGTASPAIPAVLLLVLGAVPYLLWNRDAAFISPFKDWLPDVPAPPHSAPADFLRYNFADGAWFLSLLLMQRCLDAPAAFGLLALLLAVVLETGQYAGWIPGTFDPADLLTYITLFILFKLCT